MGMESVYKLSIILNMVDQLTSPIIKASQQTNSSLSKIQSGFGTAALAGGAMTAAGVAITGGLMKVAGSTFDTQDALAELKSLGVTDLQAMEDAAKKFSDTWAGTTKADFISAAYDIKSGISSLSDEGVAQFTELAGLTAKATKSTTGEMTSLFATGYGIYKDYYSELSDMEFGEMFAGGISTAVKAYKTSGSQMAQSISTLGGTATSANVPLEEQLSILGMLQSTMSGSEAATKYKALLNAATGAGEKLGLNFLDANNQMKSLPEILSILHGKYGDTIDAMEKKSIKEAFGSDEAVAVIDLLYGKTDQLQSGILDMYDALGGGTTAAYDMASAINSTESQQYTVLKQQLHNVTEELGTNLLPTVSSWIASGTKAVGAVSEWISEHKELADTIMNVALFLGVFLAVTGSVTSIIGVFGGGITKAIKLISSLKGGFETLRIFGMYAKDGIKALGSGLINMVRQGIASAAAALPGLIASVWSFTAALLANPITWIVIAVVALVAILVLLWNKCEWFRDGVMVIWQAVKDGVSDAFAAVEQVFGGIADFFGNVLGAAKDTVSEKLNNIKNAYESHGGGIQGVAAAAIEGVKGFYSAGFTFLDKLTGGKLTDIKNKFSEKLAPIGKIVGGVMDAAKATATETLNNMKDAYESHGGGIQGAVAATMEGVKGFFGAGYTFIDNLTGGKLTEIKGKFFDGVTAIRDGIGEKIADVGAKFSQGIENIKTSISDAITWFFTSGQKVVTTFAEGIKNGFSVAVDTVKGGLQKIRNMLPFSDAKEGPLSQLTLSGRKVFETINTGMGQTAALPAETAREAFQSLSDENGEGGAALTRAMKDNGSSGSSSYQGTGQSIKSYFKTETNAGGDTIIQRLELQVSLDKLKDLPLIFKLIDEIKEKANGNVVVATP